MASSFNSRLRFTHGSLKLRRMLVCTRNGYFLLHLINGENSSLDLMTFHIYRNKTQHTIEPNTSKYIYISLVIVNDQRTTDKGVISGTFLSFIVKKPSVGKTD